MLQQHLKAAAGTIPENWSAWLSLNQDNDGTAIWLELKFNVPQSGSWRDANIFQVPMVPQPCNSTAGYPGIIIFERTPVSGVDDPLERLVVISCLLQVVNFCLVGNIECWMIAHVCEISLNRYPLIGTLFHPS